MLRHPRAGRRGSCACRARGYASHAGLWLAACRYDPSHVRAMITVFARWTPIGICARVTLQLFEDHVHTAADVRKVGMRAVNTRVYDGDHNSCASLEREAPVSPRQQAGLRQIDRRGSFASTSTA